MVISTLCVLLRKMCKRPLCWNHCVNHSPLQSAINCLQQVDFTKHLRCFFFYSKFYFHFTFKIGSIEYFCRNHKQLFSAFSQVNLSILHNWTKLASVYWIVCCAYFVVAKKKECDCILPTAPNYFTWNIWRRLLWLFLFVLFRMYNVFLQTLTVQIDERIARVWVFFCCCCCYLLLFSRLAGTESIICKLRAMGKHGW